MKLISVDSIDDSRCSTASCDVLGVCETNEIALFKFRNGDGKTAMILLLRALRSLLLSPITTESTAPTKNINAFYPSEMRHSNSLQYQVNVTVVTSAESFSSHHSSSVISSHRMDGCTYSCSNKNSLFLYTKPFRFAFSASSFCVYSNNENNSLAVMSAILLFNLALIQHITGMRHLGNGKSSLLNKALLLYGESYRQISHCKPLVAVLVAAICNNTLHLHHHYYYDRQNGREQLAILNHSLAFIENSYIPRRACSCDSRYSNSKRSLLTRGACIMMIDPRAPQQVLMAKDLHQFRLTHAFITMHDFRLSPAA